MSARIVIAAYRPKPGKETELRALMSTHVPRLRAAGFATEREPILMVAKDGTFVEVFEWKSQQAIDDAHEHPDVLKMWQEYAACSSYVPIGEVAEAAELFSGFSPA